MRKFVQEVVNGIVNGSLSERNRIENAERQNQYASRDVDPSYTDH